MKKRREDFDLYILFCYTELINRPYRNKEANRHNKPHIPRRTGPHQTKVYAINEITNVTMQTLWSMSCFTAIVCIKTDSTMNDAGYRTEHYIFL